MDDFQRSLARLPPDWVAAVAAGLSMLLPVVAFAWAVSHGHRPAGGSVAAAVGAVVIVAAGLYAFRLGAPGRSG